MHGRLKAEGKLLPALGSASNRPVPARKPAFINRKRNDSKVIVSMMPGLVVAATTFAMVTDLCNTHLP